MRNGFSLLSVIAISSTVLSAQNILGTITGIVTDSSGAVIHNAAVTARNEQTGELADGFEKKRIHQQLLAKR